MGILVNLSLILLLTFWTFVSQGIQLPAESFYLEGANILIEPESVVAVHDSYTTQTFSVHFPGLTQFRLPKKAVNCSHVGSDYSGLITKIQTHFSEFLATLPTGENEERREPCSINPLSCFHLGNQNSRRKRVVPLILGVAGVAAVSTALYYHVGYKEMETHINSLTENQGALIDHIQKQESNMEEWQQLTHEILVKVEKRLNKIFERIDALECKQDLEHVLNLWAHQLTLEIAEIKSYLEDIIEGTIPRSLINLKILSTRILMRPEYGTESIYLSDPSLFYTLSKSYLLRVDLANNIVSFLMVTPLVNLKDISILYKSHNLGWENQSLLHKYEVPKTFFTMGEGDTLSVVDSELNSCKSLEYLFICNTKRFSSSIGTTCLESLIKNNSGTSCKILVQSNPPIISPTIVRSGIIVRSYSKIEMYKKIRGLNLKRVRDYETTPLHPKFFPFQDDISIKIDGNIFSSARIALDIHYKYFTPNVSTEDYSSWKDNLAGDIDTDLQNLIKLNKEMSRYVFNPNFSINKHHGKWGFVIGVLIASILLGMWIVIRRRRSAIRRHPKILVSSGRSDTDNKSIVTFNLGSST